MTAPKLAIGSKFHFDTAAWRSSKRVQKMTYDEKGRYLELLIEQWDHRTIPATPAACADTFADPIEGWEDAWPKLAPCFGQRARDGALVNPRLESERRSKLAYLRKQQASGRKGGKRSQQKKLTGKGRLRGAQPSLGRPSSNKDDLNELDLIGSNSSTTDQNLRSAASPRPVENSARTPSDDGNYRVILKITHEVLDAYPGLDPADQREAVKELCAKRRITYNSDVVQRAFESALEQRAVRT